MVLGWICPGYLWLIALIVGLDICSSSSTNERIIVPCRHILYKWRVRTNVTYDYKRI
jgi:hypothetical protein